MSSVNQSISKLKVSVVIPVKNEEATIKILLESLFSQTRLPDEVVITDGGSNDYTKNIISEYIENGFPIKLFCLSQAFPGKGRNFSVDNSQFDIIACIDAGCRPDERWLQEIVMPFEQDPGVEVVFGQWVPDAKSLLEKCVVSITVPPADWPSVACMACKKDFWNKIGGFPEQLRTHEDAIFIEKTKKSGSHIFFNLKAIIYWRPRSTLSSFLKQWYEYSRGIGHIKVQTLFHVRKTLFYMLVLIFLWLGFLNSFLFLLLAGLIYFCWIYLTIKEHFKWFEVIKKEYVAYLILPLIIFIRDLAAIFGFFHGTWQRVTNPKLYKMTEDGVE